jgi:2-oxoglutarate dehydrogenase E2 component (dihydrolipoamide succinyltransferase)
MQGDFFAARKARPELAKLGTHDVYGDPKLAHLVEGDAALDVRPMAGGAGIDAGVAVPADWPDSLRAADRGKPDIGALPLGAAMLQVGPAAQAPAPQAPAAPTPAAQAPAAPTPAAQAPAATQPPAR